MTTSALFQFLFFVAVTVALMLPLGSAMARVFNGKPVALTRIFGPVERLIYRLIGIHADEQQGWVGYMAALLLFNALGGAALFVMLRYQDRLP